MGTAGAGKLRSARPLRGRPLMTQKIPPGSGARGHVVHSIPRTRTFLVAGGRTKCAGGRSCLRRQCAVIIFHASSRPSQDHRAQSGLAAMHARMQWYDSAGTNGWHAERPRLPVLVARRWWCLVLGDGATASHVRPIAVCALNTPRGPMAVVLAAGTAALCALVIEDDGDVKGDSSQEHERNTTHGECPPRRAAVFAGARKFGAENRCMSSLRVQLSPPQQCIFVRRRRHINRDEYPIQRHDVQNGHNSKGGAEPMSNPTIFPASVLPVHQNAEDATE